MTTGQGRAWTVQRWFALILTVLLALIGIGVVGAAVSLSRTQNLTDELTGKLLPARAAAYQLQSALLNQETGIRGYALSGDGSFLAPYNDGVQLQQRSTTQLRELLVSRPELLTDVDRVERASERWREDFATPILSTVAATDPTSAAARTDAELSERGKVAFDDLRGVFDVQNRDLEAARAAAQDDLTRARALRTLVFASIFATLLVASIGFAVLIRMAVILPLRRLATSSREVVEGNFGHTVDAGNGPSDIRALAGDVEAMRQRIVAELDLVRDRQVQLEDQARRLDEQSVELRRSNAELEQFAYVTSHDLQEPLRKVASFCQLLEKRYGDVLDDRGRQYIDFAVDGAKRMQILINDLLAFSRVGRVNDGFQRTSLDAGLDKALSNLAVAVEESGARITRPEDLPDVHGDPTLIAMLWQNLIGNAVKFAREGVVPEITITSARAEESDKWLISVQDNGIGIAPEFAEKIFVIFQRLHARDEFTGTGIGLSLCKKIVEYHGGEIWLDPEYTEGTRFHFTLPALTEGSSPFDLSQGAAV